MRGAGDRDRRIVFERNAPFTNDHGDEVQGWQHLCKAWARVTFGSGAERRGAAQERATQTATFECLAIDTSRAAVTDRIKFDGSLWDITSRALVGRDQIHFTAIMADGENEE